MIKSEKQYLAALSKAKTLEESLNAIPKAGVPKILQKSSQGQVKELLSEIYSEIREYEQLKNSQVKEIPIRSLDDLMSAPIRYRLATHMSVEEFARVVDIHSRQIARYESENYRNVTIETLLKILGKINVHLSGEVKIPQPKAS